MKSMILIKVSIIFVCYVYMVSNVRADIHDDGIACLSLGYGEWSDVPIGNTLVCPLGFDISTNFNNNGEIFIENATGRVLENGELNNYGYIKNEYHFNLYSGAVFTNHIGSRFDSSEDFRVFDGALVENYGTINFIPNVGDGFNNIRFQLDGGFINHNKCFIDHPSIDFINFDGNLTNKGLFEISSRSSIHSLISYIQEAGETIVNGDFSVANLRLNGGVVSGNGTLTASQSLILGQGAGFSPKSSTSSFGTLTINTDDVLVSALNYVNIELGTDSDNYDTLQVNGDLSLFGTINVTLQGIPAIGEEFEIVRSDNSIYYGQSLKINLPAILQWDVVYTDTAIVVRRI